MKSEKEEPNQAKQRGHRRCLLGNVIALVGGTEQDVKGGIGNARTVNQTCE